MKPQKYCTYKHCLLVYDKGHDLFTKNRPNALQLLNLFLFVFNGDLGGKNRQNSEISSASHSESLGRGRDMACTFQSKLGTGKAS